MRLLRFIWQDLRWLNSFSRTVKIAGLILGVVLIVGAWYLGADFWTRPRTSILRAREVPLVETVGVIIDIMVVTYIVGLIERDRRSR